MLKLNDVHTYYVNSYILQGVSLEVKRGYVVALLGRNGVGKSTVIHSIIGFTPPRYGTIRFKDKDITGLPPHQIARMGIGLVPQGRRIFTSLSVEENLIMAARGGGKSGAWNLDKIYSFFPILKERAENRGNLLSGGEQQTLSIARALMTNADLLIMDEPSEGLAPLVLQKIGDITMRLKEDGFSILLVEQNLPMALKLADYVYIISKGVIVYESKPEELRNNEEVKAEYLGVTG